MRLHLWLAILTGTISTLGIAGSAQSQGVYPPGAGVGTYPPGATMGGGPGDQFSGMYPPPGGYPSYYQPYPSISPYEHEYQQIANRAGIWEQDSQSRIGMPNRWRFRTEYVSMEARQGKRLLGNSKAPTYREQIIPTLEDAGGGGGGNNLDDYIDALSGLNNGIGFNLFDPVSAQELERPELRGLRLTLEAENVDGSGLEFWGLWAKENDNEFNAKDDVDPSRGNQQAFVIAMINDPTLQNPTNPPANFPDPVEVLQNNLLNLRGIPLDDGTIETLSDGTTFGGASAVYDLAFQVRTDIEIYGAGLRWKSMPLYKSDSIRIRPNTGLRYTAVNDMFSFYGQDSGILYDGQTDGSEPPLPEVKLHSLPNRFDDDGDGIVDNAGLIEDQFGGQGGGGGGGTGTANFVFPTNTLVYPVTSLLFSDVESHLAGPEIGLSYDFGGEKGFRMGGSSNFGVLVNYQRMQLSGDNIFVTTREADLLPRTPTNARPNAFSSTEEHTSVSPMFEQMFYAEGPLFQYIPMLRRSALLRNANFRAAYTLTYIGELARASDSIVWQGNPSMDIFPVIETSRSTFTATSWDFGVSWSW